MALQKWKLLSKENVSPSPWFPIENRTYELPNGMIVDDFTVTTIADVSMVIPVTKDKKLVLVRQYKPGVDEITIEFPAGRIEPRHTDFRELALHELEEEAGIRASQIEEFAVFAGFVTKGSERIHCFLARDVEFNSAQSFDPNEEIEVVLFTFAEFDQAIREGKILGSQSIAIWYVAKLKYPDLFS